MTESRVLLLILFNVEIKFTGSSILNVGRGPKPAFDYNGIS